MPRRGVIYTVAPSYQGRASDLGRHRRRPHSRTADGGKTWQNVTPPGLTSWSKVSIIDAGRFDADTAYAAINRIRLDDQKPHIYRTHDGGKTWKEIVHGLPDNAPINPCAKIRKGRASLRRHGTSGVRFVQRRRRLATAKAEYAGHLDPRPGGP